MKLSDLAEKSSTTEDLCRSQCSGNCSCVVYAYDTVIGCMSWSKMIDIQQFQSSGKDLYIRVAHSELDHYKNIKKIVIPVILGTHTLSVCLFICFTMMARRRGVKRKVVILLADRSAVYMEELPVFSLDMLANATSQFHEDNKLGQGVAEIGDSFYGKLEDGKEIAVKRLSKASRQGLEEFMNEVLVISKVQHRNLVRLLRCCVNKDEKMLIYEYMKLGCVSLWFVLTLDQSFLHLIQHEGHRGILDWIRRSIIIEGVGRGLLYLHKDSRLKIIDRDLKPSNILLDNNFNPKISDFVMARIFGSDQDQADTRRVVVRFDFPSCNSLPDFPLPLPPIFILKIKILQEVAEFSSGYMAPEYATGRKILSGKRKRFSDKSDVFSFGVLVLKIISGRKSTISWNETSSLSLLRYVRLLLNANFQKTALTENTHST
ncbi:G-type lectin S-receptor-like serine/threonine-protein kinase At1g11330 [Capsicum annuum]|uniref:G-type lectin S-receptor-like serine/threonine-protein kinase At1g11330 n=1 Tax=Capsicum annuum TaxID=4072 RepID=UPI001FB187DD|nr:G-type lectin S-receptor-like serine/threonine-protein kinase At1g11330 [Capsicum annuum]